LEEVPLLSDGWRTGFGEVLDVTAHLIVLLLEEQLFSVEQYPLVRRLGFYGLADKLETLHILAKLFEQYSVVEEGLRVAGVALQHSHVVNRSILVVPRLMMAYP
jgi:hypothetical protein